MAVMAENVFVPWYADSWLHRLIDSAGQRQAATRTLVYARFFGEDPAIISRSWTRVASKSRISSGWVSWNACLSARGDSISIRLSNHPVAWRPRRDIWSRTSILPWLLCNRLVPRRETWRFENDVCPSHVTKSAVLEIQAHPSSIIKFTLFIYVALISVSLCIQKSRL